MTCANEITASSFPHMTVCNKILELKEHQVKNLMLKWRSSGNRYYYDTRAARRAYRIVDSGMEYLNHV